MTASEKITLCNNRGPFRYISIDGCHTAEHTCSDLLTAQDWLADGVIIMLDDYYNIHWPGVHEGTGDSFRKYSAKVKPFFYTSNKLFPSSMAY